MLVVPTLFELILVSFGSQSQVSLNEALFDVGISSLISVGLLARIRVTRFLAIFWFVLVGIYSLLMSLLPILQMFPFRYFTLQAAVLNGLTLLIVAGLFAAAVWLNGNEGKRWFSPGYRSRQKSPNNGFNSDAGKARAG